MVALVGRREQVLKCETFRHRFYVTPTVAGIFLMLPPGVEGIFC